MGNSKRENIASGRSEQYGGTAAIKPLVVRSLYYQARNHSDRLVFSY